jgi:hypothetical protein
MLPEKLHILRERGRCGLETSAHNCGDGSDDEQILFHAVPLLG